MLGARKGPSENEGHSTIVFSVYCLNKYMQGQWKNFCSAPAALGQNMLIADGIVEVSHQTLVRPYLTHGVEIAANLCMFMWKCLKLHSPCPYDTWCSYQCQLSVTETGRTSAFQAFLAAVCSCCVNYL